MSSEHPSIVTIKVFSSGTPQVSLVNVMSVINNPDETTLRSVISSEIQAANNPTTPSSQLLAAFDDKKHIASVETSSKTNIKQLLDLPMSILLKQQVGIQDGVINVTVDTPPSPIVNKPPHSSSSSRVIINNKNRTNPFKNSSRQNFPPLEEFFRGSPSPPLEAATTTSSTPSSSRASMRSSLTSKTTTPSSSSPSPSKHHDFSLDMSIAGRAAMAHHRYQIEKYGIDGDDNDKISPLSEERDWDHLMDSSSSPSNKSVALTDINNTLSLSRICESSILSPSIMTDVSGTGDSYFDKSIIEALKTPEKFAGSANNNNNGIAQQQQQQVTLSRGQGNDLDYSDDENSICDDTSTHVTNTTNGSAGVGLNGIFRAAMKMHNNNNGYDKKRDDNGSTVSTNISMRSRGNNSKGRRKSLSVSFALDDESFAIEKHSSAKKAHQHRGIIGCNDEEEDDEFGEFLLSPIGKEENKDVTFCVDSSFIAHQSSPACSRVEGSCDDSSPNVSPSGSVNDEAATTTATTPLQDGGEAFAAATSTTLSLLGPTADTPSPKQQNEGILRSQSLDECFRRKLLFDSPEQKLAVSEIGAFGGMDLTSSAIKNKEKEGLSSMEFTTKLSDSSYPNQYKSLSRNDTHTTVPLEESSFVSQQKSLHDGGGRVFGSDAASRLNRQMEIERRNNRPNSSDDSTVKSTASSKSDYKKGGTHLSGISKWISLSFDMMDKACTS